MSFPRTRESSVKIPYKSLSIIDVIVVDQIQALLDRFKQDISDFLGGTTNIVPGQRSISDILRTNQDGSLSSFVTDTKTRWLPNLTKENWVIEISEFIAFVEKNKIPKLFGGMSRSYISALTELDKLLSARYKLPLLLENLSRTVDAQRMLMSAVVSKQGQALQTLSQLKAQLPPEGEEGQYADLQSFTSTVQKTLEGAQQAVLDLQRQNEKQEAALRGQAEERARLAEQAILIHV